jgi:hypothetical protein
LNAQSAPATRGRVSSKRLLRSDTRSPFNAWGILFRYLRPPSRRRNRLGKRQLCVQRSAWKGHVTATKGGRLRYVPLTVRLSAALREHRHLRGARVLCQSDSSPLTQKIVQDHVRRAARRAQLATSGVHRLRHTFCSHLAMRGAPARAIQDLAGHFGSSDDPTVHAPESRGARGCDPVARSAQARLRVWRHFGDADRTNANPDG